MAKSSGKSTQKKSSTSKSAPAKRKRGGPETDPPILIKSGGLPKRGPLAGEPLSLMDMQCKDPMDFSWVESDTHPFEYYYPQEIGEVMNQITLTIAGMSKSYDVTGKVWSIEFTIGEIPRRR